MNHRSDQWRSWQGFNLCLTHFSRLKGWMVTTLLLYMKPDSFDVIWKQIFASVCMLPSSHLWNIIHCVNQPRLLLPKSVWPFCNPHCSWYHAVGSGNSGWTDLNQWQIQDRCKRVDTYVLNISSHQTQMSFYAVWATWIKTHTVSYTGHKIIQHHLLCHLQF